MVTSALQWWSWEVATQTIWLLNPKIFILWLFIEKTYRSLCLAFASSTLYIVDAQTIAVEWMKGWLKAEIPTQNSQVGNCDG